MEFGGDTVSHVICVNVLSEGKVGLSAVICGDISI
jgi:hypothetical protein